jgi:hypothetical protein
VTAAGLSHASFVRLLNRKNAMPNGSLKPVANVSGRGVPSP